jgi:hypothetical protein
MVMLLLTGAAAYRRFSLADCFHTIKKGLELESSEIWVGFTTANLGRAIERLFFKNYKIIVKSLIGFYHCVRAFMIRKVTLRNRSKNHWLSYKCHLNY